MHCKLVLTPQRTCMLPANFELVMFLRENRNMWDVTTLAALGSSSHLQYSTTPSRDLGSTRNVKHILHFSDVHLNISKSLNATESEAMAFKYGGDTPLTLLTSGLEFAKKLMPDPAFFLYTGDHVVRGNFSGDFVAETVKTNVQTMAHYYATKDNDTSLDITALIGNTDTAPSYTMNVTDPATETNPSITLISAAWQETLPKSNLDWFNHRGYLTYDLDEKLVVLTLNTLPYSPIHYPDTTNISDPFGQFAWLNETLLELRNAGKFAYIVGHIPPIIDSFGGAQMWEVEYITTYKSIVAQFADIIKAQFFAHVHSIEFRVPLIAEQQQQEATNGAGLVPLFMSAAISPIYGNNPAFMVWDFDASTYEVLDFTVYGSNISSDNQELDWQPLFTASTAYGVNSLRTSELNTFVKRAASDSALLEQYYYNSKAQSYLQSPCKDASCRAKWLCTMQWFTTSDEFQACVAELKAGN
ncbi:Sphingomyelinase phosphodiesterase D [Phytophthora citrophthora]|uniref:Sphingomyelinase phosphodiesterase D n=1 Tax=Phytophthora citrophthora TaxID=4793 RepID=A0AAD9GYH2_9STRA|nr:Sphingomyelinase phosphodiesterase D [Phytophthora citrophthora]